MTYSDLLAQIHRVNAAIRQPDEREVSHLEQRQYQYLKWRLVHEYVRTKPFRDNPRQPRSRQWQDAMNQMRELRDQEVLDWLWVQSDVSRNHERGIQDMRPARRGTCHEALVEYLRMREHKAQVVLQWEEEAQEHGCYRVDGAFHARTKEILDKLKRDHPDLDDGDDPSWQYDPWLRS